MAEQKQSSSDPLPYVQIDRAVMPKAAQLADLIRTTRQHALGSLVEFWNSCGEPRELERLVAEGKREVVLSAEVVRRRFKNASGHDVDPVELEALSILEARAGDQFRVRGMSRYFAPIERRVGARAAAKAGGDARAKGLRDAGGKFVPTVTGGGAPAGGSGGGRVDASQPGTSREPADGPAGNQPTDQPGTSRRTTTADSGQRTAEEKEEVPQAARPPPEFKLEPPRGKKETKLSPQQQLARRFWELRREFFGENVIPDTEWSVVQINDRLKRLAAQNLEPPVFDDLVRRYCEDKAGKEPPAPLAFFVQDWPKYKTRHVRGDP